MSKEIIEKCKIKKKPLELLHTIAFNIELMGITCFGDELRTIEQALKRIVDIDNSNPSKALECLKRVWNDINDQNDFRQDFKDLTIVENYIIKAQEQEKALEIVFEKNVNIEYLKESDNVKEYNSKITIVIDGIKYAKSMARKLTQKEFELLKRWQSKDKSE